MIIFQSSTLSEIYTIFFVSLIVNYLIDQDHKFNKKAKWYFKRTWIQEPFSIVLIALPLWAVISIFNKYFANCFFIIWVSHIIADYLCIFPARPLAPFNNRIIKPEGCGIFYPDALIFKTENEMRWKERVRRKGIRAVSENLFTGFLLPLLIIYLLIFY